MLRRLVLFFVVSSLISAVCLIYPQVIREFVAGLAVKYSLNVAETQRITTIVAAGNYYFRIPFSGIINSSVCRVPLVQPCAIIVPAEDPLNFTLDVFSAEKGVGTYRWSQIDALIQPSHQVREVTENNFRKYAELNPNPLTVHLSMEPFYAVEELENVLNISLTYRKSTAEIPRLYFEGFPNLFSNNGIAALSGPGVIKGASFMASKGTVERDRLVQYFIDKYPNSTSPLRDSAPFVFDSLGQHLHYGPQAPTARYDSKWWDAKLETTKKYMFNFAFENSALVDYVTEKIMAPLLTGVLPVYWGAPNIDDFVPKRSIIKVSDFNSLDDLSKYLEHLVANLSEYLSYFDWQNDLTLRAHMKWMDPFLEPSQCRLCRYVEGIKYENKTKTDWDRLQQEWN